MAQFESGKSNSEAKPKQERRHDMTTAQEMLLGDVDAAIKQLSDGDREEIDRDVASRLVQTFRDKRTRVADVGDAIRFTLSEKHISNKSREVYAAYARLLRRVERDRGKGAA